MSEEIPSRLKARADGVQPVRGVGAAYAQNQALAGVRNPEQAASMARKSPSELEAEVEKRTALDSEMETKRAELVDAITSGQWKPAVDLPKSTDYEALLEKQPVEVVRKWHDEMIEARDQSIEEDEEAAIAAALGTDFNVQPDDHLYDPLRDKARRERIEAKLQPLDFEQMLFLGYSEQDVEIRPSFTVTFRTISTQHGLWMEHYISSMPDMSTQELRHTYSLLQVAASLEKINGKPVGTDISKLVRPDQQDAFVTALKQRMEVIGRYPVVLSDDLIVQSIWFNGRVRKMLAGNLVEKVGN